MGEAKRENEQKLLCYFDPGYQTKVITIELGNFFFYFTLQICSVPNFVNVAILYGKRQI